MDRPNDVAHRQRPDKRMTAAEAVRAFVRDGDVVCAAGFSHLIPYALGHEVIRQVRRGLTFVKQTPDLLGEQLLAAGCLRKIVFSWEGNPGLGNLALFWRIVQGGAGRSRGAPAAVPSELPGGSEAGQPGLAARGAQC